MLGARYICASLLAVASLSLTSANLNMDNVCALVNDGFMIGSHDACDYYYICSNGFAIMRYCGAGNYFDKELQMCMPQDEVNCKVPCAGYSIGTLAPVNGSCSSFYHCSANGTELRYCANGENYNPTLQQCVSATLYPCSESTDSNVPINLCTIIPNDLYFGNPSSCYAWNKCIDNVLTTGLCPTGSSYSVLVSGCIHPSYGTCRQVTNDPYLTDNTCSVYGENRASGSCSSYYACNGTNYQLAKCSSGLFYDTVSKICVSRLNARNDCNRCEGVTKGFANQYSRKNCEGFLYCLNGEEVASDLCLPGSYCDERAGGCLVLADDPLFGCCNPAFYDTSLDGNTTDASVTTDASLTTET